ncbi:MAG: DUF1697 domain-containing protein [Candidatus Saccharimonadales bacterium]
MTTYLALLRGVNVGGKAMLKMADLAQALTDTGFERVTTYIQSGNVIVHADDKDKQAVAEVIKACIKKDFDLSVEIALFTSAEWREMIEAAPSWWGKDAEWKHNLLVLTEPVPMKEVVVAIGDLKPDIENMEPGTGVLYQSMSRKLFGRTTTGKLAASPIYKKMTIRNYNTATKLLKLLD